MRVNLISYTKPSEEMFKAGLHEAQDLIAYCARVSNPANQYNTDTAEKLVMYLIKNKHWSPLEMVNIVLEIETTRDIAHQIVRHRSFSFQEFSQRYADPTKELHFVLREARLQDPKNRQNSVVTSDVNLGLNWELQQKKVIETARAAYDWAIANGIAKEQARVVLPEGNTTTRLYMNGTLRSWVHYIDLRAGNGTQKEHMDVAKACARVIAEVFPLINKVVNTTEGGK
jgi:thymidylate synthase (FAD)